MLQNSTDPNNGESNESSGRTEAQNLDATPTANLTILETNFAESASDLLDPFDEDEGFSDSEAPLTGPGPIPEHLLALGGLMGSVMEYTATTAHCDQPTLALGGAIAMMATLVGRRVTDVYGTRSNVYCLAIAPTTSGKEQPRKTNDRCLTAAGLGGRQSGVVGPESLNSHSGILTQLALRPVLLSQIDEIGRFFATVNSRSAASYQRAVIDMLLKLYSRSDRIYRGDALKNERETRPIIRPHLSVCASTVPDNFFSAMTRETLTGGLLGRFLVFPGLDDPPRRDPLDHSPPQELTDRISAWGRFHPHSIKPLRDDDEEPTPETISFAELQPQIIPYEDEAIEVFQRLNGDVLSRTHGADEIIRALYGRSLEKARKLALIKACSDGIPSASGLRVTAEVASWACQLVSHQTEWILYHARERLAETAFEADGNELRRYLAGKGGKASRTDICNRFRKWDSSYREKVVQGQCDAGRLWVETEETGGRSKTSYVLR